MVTTVIVTSSTVLLTEPLLKMSTLNMLERKHMLRCSERAGCAESKQKITKLISMNLLNQEKKSYRFSLHRRQNPITFRISTDHETTARLTLSTQKIGFDTSCKLSP